MDLYQSVSRLPDQKRRRHSREEEILLGSGQGGQPPLAGHQHEYGGVFGFNAFNTKKITGQDTIDFIEFRRQQTEGAAFDMEFMAAVLGKPQE